MLDAITAQRLRLIGRLESFDADQWDAPSLCAGWRVRDVIGHLVSILDMPVRRIMLGSVKAGGFHRFAERVAKEYGERDPVALTARYPELATRRFAPPVVGPIAPMGDVFVHTRDIERPLGMTATSTRSCCGRCSTTSAGVGPVASCQPAGRPASASRRPISRGRPGRVRGSKARQRR